MKKLIMLVSCLVLSLGSIAYAATEVNTTVTVTVLHLSVSIDGTPAFGTISAGDTFKLADTSCTVTNDGSWESKWSLKCSDSANWTPTVDGAAPADNTHFRLCAVFKSTPAVTSDFDAAGGDHVDGTYQLSGTVTAEPFYQYPGYGGQNVTGGSTRHLWLSFCAPNTTGGNPNSSEQTITVYVQTQAQ